MATFSKRSAFLLMATVDTLAAHLIRLFSDEEVAKRVSSRTLSRQRLPDSRPGRSKEAARGGGRHGPSVSLPTWRCRAVQPATRPCLGRRLLATSCGRHIRRHSARDRAGGPRWRREVTSIRSRTSWSESSVATATTVTSWFSPSFGTVPSYRTYVRSVKQDVPPGRATCARLRCDAGV